MWIEIKDVQKDLPAAESRPARALWIEIKGIRKIQG